jgi:transposase-like protein
MKNRRKFTAKQKADIVLSVIKEENKVVEIGKKYEIAPTLIYRWKDSFLENADKVFENKEESKETDRKIKKYENVIAKLTTQNDFLDKVLAHLK